MILVEAPSRVTVPSPLRVPEKLFLAFLAYLTTAALFFPLDIRQRLTLIAINSLAAMVFFLLGRHGVLGRSRFLTVVRDWLPCFLILVAYRESGLFFTQDPTHRLDHILIRWDDMVLKNPWVVQTLTWGAPWIQRYLEFAYFLCYPIVPLGLASLYLVKRNRTGAHPRTDSIDPPFAPAIEHFWTAVLLASFTCYLLFPLFPLTPPRELFNDVPGPRVAPFLRGMNHWLLGHYAVGASLFPSAHVAATTAMALVIRRYLPRFGWIFVVIAVSIALATVYGRYHYAADAVAGALVGFAAFLIADQIQYAHGNESHLKSTGVR
jgi:membrane-associated phospholipid phosphatase